MWKRDEAVRQPAVPTPEAAVPAAATQVARQDSPKAQGQGRDVVNIGKSVVIKGELNGSEDLTIEGHVEGKIELREHVLTIGPNGKIKAELYAKAVVVLGEVIGNVSASEKVDIRENGSVEGDIIAPRVAIAEGAHFRGSVDMQTKAPTKPGESKPRPAAPVAETKPQGAPPQQPVAVQGQPQQQGQPGPGQPGHQRVGV
jgi:cytoskeletal protein CcmA (bactofilin family)